MFFFFKQKTAYEIKECDWSSDVCSSDLFLLLNNNLVVCYYLIIAKFDEINSFVKSGQINFIVSIYGLF